MPHFTMAIKNRYKNSCKTAIIIMITMSAATQHIFSTGHQENLKLLNLYLICLNSLN